jgi:hypothetical protein
MSGALGRAWARWVALTAAQEPAHGLAVVRIGVGGLIFIDRARLSVDGLVGPLLAPAGAGGLGDPLGQPTPPVLYRLLPVDPAAALAVVEGAHALSLAAAASLSLGLWTRSSAALLLVLLSQFAGALPPADRGVDLLLRNVLAILALSGAGRAWALDARRAGPQLTPAWPRRLLLLQLGLVYLGAAAAKVASPWTPAGGGAALSFAARDPAYARLPAALVLDLHPLAQMMTISTLIWEWGALLWLAALGARATRTAPGRLRALSNRLGMVGLYLWIGAVFHLGTHLLLRIDVFPFVMLALYAAAAPPEAWARGAAALRRRVTGR